MVVGAMVLGFVAGLVCVKRIGPHPLGTSRLSNLRSTRNHFGRCPSRAPSRWYEARLPLVNSTPAYESPSAPTGINVLPPGLVRNLLRDRDKRTCHRDLYGICLRKRKLRTAHVVPCTGPTVAHIRAHIRFAQREAPDGGHGAPPVLLGGPVTREENLATIRGLAPLS